jgi:hypothetical protein
MINAKLQNLYNIKNDIGTAIVNKGGTITESTPFYSYAGQIDNISTGPGAYSKYVVQDITNTKYTVYNGYDATLNPVNNTFDGPNIVGTNEANMPFVGNTVSYGGFIESVTTNNGFIYVGGGTNQTVQKFHESNLVRVGNTAIYGGSIKSVTTNNGFIYVGGGSNITVQKFHESNLAFVGNTASYGGEIQSITTNDGFIYVGGESNQTVQKFHESNLVRVGNTNNYGGPIRSVTTNNGFIYAGGQSNQRVQKFHEGNLAFVGSTTNYGGAIASITTNNGFIYAGGATNQTIQKFHEGNLAFIGNTVSYGGTIESVTTNNGFIYAGGGTPQTVQKFHESNLVRVGNTNNYGSSISEITTNNGFIYVVGGAETVQKFQEAGAQFEQLPVPNFTYPFNRWELNNSTTGDVTFSNTTVVTNGTYNGPNTTLNQSVLFALQSTSGQNGIGNVSTIYDGNIYVGTRNSTFNASRINRLPESNVSTITANSPTTGATNISAIKANNGFVYIGHSESFGRVQKYNTNSLSFVGNSAFVGSFIGGITVNNGFIFATTQAQTISKIHEGNLVIDSNSATLPRVPLGITHHNGFLYVGSQNNLIWKIHESNLVVNATYNFATGSGYVNAVDVDSSGFVYASGFGLGVLGKFNSNLGLVASVSQPTTTESWLQDINASSDFLYTITQSSVYKYHKSNLVSLVNAGFGGPNSISVNGGFAYVPYPAASITVLKIRPYNIATFDNRTLYSIQSLKEE